MEHFSFANYLEQKLVLDIAAAVEEAMWPFNPGRVNVYVTATSYEPWSRYVNVDTYHFSTQVPLEQDDLLTAHPYELIRSAVSETFRKFLLRPRVEPEPNIILGEE